jgi:hypothetical protein
MEYTLRSLYVPRMPGVDVFDNYSALKLQARPALHSLSQCNLKNSVLICVSLIPIPKRRLRYSLLELCDRRKVKRRKEKGRKPIRMLCSRISYLVCRFQTARASASLVYQKWTRKGKKEELRDAMHVAESCSCRRCINLRTRPSCCRHRLRSQDSGEPVRPPQPHHLRCRLRCHSRLVSRKCLGPFA